MIRNFLYLDSQKLRSISSQIFEGFSERVINSSLQSKSEEESQKGPVASGRVLADIFTTESSLSELKFLEDHAYTLFEDHLIKDGVVDVVDPHSLNESFSKSFVKITGRLQVNDLVASHRMLRDFNVIGEAFWRVTNTNFNDPSAKRVSEADARKKASDINMQLNRDYAAAAAKLIEFGYGDLLEAGISTNGILFSAPLKREFLRESENMILHKYSRHTQQTFFMLGVVTQRGGQSTVEGTIPDVSEAAGLKDAMRTLALHLRTFEQVFSGPSNNEIIIDPIAVYSNI